MVNKYAPIIEKFKTCYTDKSQSDNWQDWPKLLIGPKLDEAHLDKVEAELGYPLPDDYREFLRDYAGISFSPSVSFFLNQDGHEGGIWGFDDSREGNSLADGYRQAMRDCLIMSRGSGKDVYPDIHLLRDVSGPVEKLGWPEELLPIGCDEGGGTICLALFGQRPGAVFLFGSDIYLIANSFDEFMHLLSPQDGE